MSHDSKNTFRAASKETSELIGSCGKVPDAEVFLDVALKNAVVLDYVRTAGIKKANARRPRPLQWRVQHKLDAFTSDEARLVQNTTLFRDLQLAARAQRRVHREAQEREDPLEFNMRRKP